MSKYVKYITNDHFGAPVMKADRFGYCVEMLRVCLVEGFNEHTDLIKYEVIDKETVKFTYETNHNYVQDQTIKTQGLPFPELNNDFLVLSNTDLEVTCKSYLDLSAIVGNTMDVTASSKVAPLGFIEKFKDGNRSAFTTDEEEAYFCIDDEQPANWPTGTYTHITSPIVYMTDKKTDIDTDGKFIFPYDSNNPTHYKLRSFMEGAYPRNGIMNFATCSASSSGNTVSQQQTIINYTIIGNGRFFIFMPRFENFHLNYQARNMYFFGKYDSFNTSKNELSYVLLGNIFRANNTMGYYDVTKVGIKTSNLHNNAQPISNLNYTTITSRYTITYNGGRYYSMILNYNGQVSSVNYIPNDYIYSDTNRNVSGVSKLIQYPDKYTGKLKISKIYVNNDYGNIGVFPGVKWVYNANALIFKDNTILNFKDRKFYCINASYKSNIEFSSNENYIYLISFDYKDWGNYE